MPSSVPIAKSWISGISGCGVDITGYGMYLIQNYLDSFHIVEQFIVVMERMDIRKP